MAPSSRDRISVDLHGLKAALFERAQARGVSPSGLVRTTLAEASGVRRRLNRIAACHPFWRGRLSSSLTRNRPPIGWRRNYAEFRLYRDIHSSPD